MKKIFILTTIILLAVPSIAFAAPGIPHQFYGTVVFDNGPAPDGVIVEAKNGTTVVGSSLTSGGKYGYNPSLFFITDANDGSAKDLSEGQTIKFFVSGIDTGATASFVNGGYAEKNLVASGSMGTVTKSANDIITNETITVTPTTPTIINMGASLNVNVASAASGTTTVEKVEKLQNNFFSGATAVISGSNVLNAYEIKIKGTDLTITVTMHYDDAGIDESTIKPYRFNGSAWVAITPFTRDTSANTLTFSIAAAATPYAIFGAPAQQQSNNNGGGGGGGGGSTADTGAPTNTSIIIAGAAVKTDNRAVTLTLSATDANSIQMMIGNDAGFSDGAWENFTATKLWTLTAGNGVKTVYVKFKDIAGNVSAPIFSSITLEGQGTAVPKTETVVVQQVLGEKISAPRITVEQMAAEAALVAGDSAAPVLAAVNKTKDVKQETATANKYLKSLASGIKGLTAVKTQTLNNFITYGTLSTVILGAGERAGILNSYKAAFGSLPANAKQWEDALKIANGRWPTQRNTAAENKAKILFKKIYGREGKMNNQNDNAAITIMAYGLRPSARNLNSEKTAILSFKYFFKRVPSSAADWDAVRAVAYSGAKR